MKRVSYRRLFIAASLGFAAPLCITSSVVHAEDFSSGSVAPYWVESTFDSGGNEGVNAFGAPTVSGGFLVGVIPTDTPTRPSSDGGGQGYEDVEHVAAATAYAGSYYNGSLLGDLTGKTGFTATFSLTNSTITAGAPFIASEFGGETGAKPGGVRLYFKDSNYVDPDAPEYGISEWWYNPNPALVTSMNNGAETTVTADFTNLSGWSDIDGVSASAEPAAFETALGGVTSSGLSLGSGNFFSDGFGFNTGGTASINVDSISTTVPEPASLGLISMAGLVLARRRRRS